MITLRTWFVRLLTAFTALFVPTLAFAQAQTGGTAGTGATSLTQLGNFLQSFITFFDDYLVPLIFAIAFIVFLWGVYRYLILGAANEEKRKEGQQFVMWGLIGFFIMVSVWGILNLLVNSLGFGHGIRPDLPTFSQTARPATGSGTGSVQTGLQTGSGSQTQTSGNQTATPDASTSCALRVCATGQVCSLDLTGHTQCLIQT